MNSIKALLFICVMAMLTFGGAPPAFSGGTEAFEPIDAEGLIQPCRVDQSSSVVHALSDWKRAESQSIECLKKVAIDQARAMFAGPNFRGDRPEQLIVRVADSYLDLYREILNNHHGCRRYIPGPGCGNNNLLFMRTAVVLLLENIIRDMVSERNQYRF